MQASKRLIGIDLAYTVAVSVIITFIYFFFTNGLAIEKGVLSHSWNIFAIEFFSGLFFFLNGMTIALTMRDNKVSSRKMLAFLTKRGMILFLIGLSVCYFWHLNIFIAVGFMYMVAPYLVQWNSLLLRILIVVLLFLAYILLFLHVPTSIGYKIPEIHGGGIIDLTGFIFFNGYYSLLPWTLFFLSGILFGRSDIRVRGWFPPSSVLALAIIVIGAVLNVILKSQDTNYLDLVRFDNNLLNFRVIMPAFFTISVGLSMLFVNVTNYLFRAFKLPRIERFVSIISSMKYSILFGQLVICSITIVLTPGAFFNKTIFLLSYSLVASFITLYAAFFWHKKISTKGPLEWIFKRVSGSAKK
jgi:hypothetical protein